MIRLSAIVAGTAAAIAWFLYLTSLPPGVGPGPFHRDVSTLAIGLGVFLTVELALRRNESRRPRVPAARIHC